MNYVKKEEKSAASRTRCWSNSGFSLNNEPPESKGTGAGKRMETRELHDGRGEGWKRHWGEGETEEDEDHMEEDNVCVSNETCIVFLSLL